MPYLLDDEKKIRERDKQNQAALIAALGEQIQHSLNAARGTKLPAPYVKTTAAIICGMGGSAIGGDIVAALPPEYVRQPIHIVRDYSLPSYVTSKTMVIIASYSGNTEETISCMREAKRRKAKIVAIAKNGSVVRAARRHAWPLYIIPDAVIPRASLGYQAGYLLSILRETKKISPRITSPASLLSLLSELNKSLVPANPTKHNFAKQAAYILHESIPLVIGSGILAPVARRLKDQINENAKQFSCFEFLPELNHNLGEGFSFPTTLPQHLTVVLLENDYDHQQIKKRYKVLKRLLTKKGIEHFSIPSAGNSVWEQKFSAVLVSDWISYYLAILNNVNPSPVPTIEWTKKQLTR